MEQGRFADENLWYDATLTGPAWVNLAGLKNDRGYVESPARCPDSTDLSESQFEGLLSEPRIMSLLVLMFHTMSLGAKYRLTITTEADAAFAAPLLQTGWQYVFPSLYDTEDLEFGIENFWAGTVASSELDLYKRHCWIPFDEVLGQRLRIELDDQNHPDGFFDIGGAYLVSGWSPDLNFSRGREIAPRARDLVDEAPSGRLYAEEREPRRQLSLTYDMLKDGEAQRWLDAGMRARTTRTVLFAPDTSDQASLMREGFPGVFETLPAPRFTYSGLNTVAAVFKEILA